RQEQLGRGDHLPAGGMMLAAPELVEPQPVEMLDEPQIALKLESRVLADRMMRRQECAETDTRHQESSLVRSTQFHAIGRGPSISIFQPAAGVIASRRSHSKGAA